MIGISASAEAMAIYFYNVWDPYGCFSNFSPHGIDLDGESWPTVEHYYQAQKFLGTPAAGIIPQIKGAATPQKAAELGRDLQHRTPRLDWDQIKVAVMTRAVRIKFLTHLDIQAILLSTGDELLIEKSPTDYFWGCGLDQSGLNHLGQILMQIRTEIRQSPPPLPSKHSL